MGFAYLSRTASHSFLQVTNVHSDKTKQIMKQQQQNKEIDGSCIREPAARNTYLQVILQMYLYVAANLNNHKKRR